MANYIIAFMPVQVRNVLMKKHGRKKDVHLMAAAGEGVSWEGRVGEEGREAERNRAELSRDKKTLQRYHFQRSFSPTT